MIDLHVHTLLSDGGLLPAEMVQRAKEKGYKAIALTDHTDSSNLEYVVKGVLKAAEDLNKWGTIKVIPGVEITHVPLKGIKELVKKARKMGAKLVIVHGETIAEPVLRGTNKAAIGAGADILAHPGLITSADVKLAKENGTYLEISARVGHSLTNGHVARLAAKIGAKLIFSTDAHEPEDLVTDKEMNNILQGCGLGKGAIDEVMKNAKDIVKRAGK